jgi:flavin reductase (DIM6/NTAB) family NADH-FMN oxidoreductase RutF
MEINFQDISPRERYKLLSSTVIPRPIALVSSRGLDGIDNAAPYSFFNVFSEDPPIVILGLQNKDDGSPKDTTRNILGSGEFVVNLIDRKMAEAMNNCAVDFPPEVSEFDITGLNRAPCKLIGANRIAEAPVALECRQTFTIKLNKNRDICLGEVLYMHIRDDIIDAKTKRIKIENYEIVARLFADYYAGITDPYALERIDMPDWYNEWIGS